ncbi:MAG: chromate resistance protein [Polyangiaceae bacterium]|nr:chromate resistance protein [Polyangiaceae bacterium]
MLLVHRLPPEPAYLRVKVGRRLARIGAVPLKSTVYVLPRSAGSLEDFEWLRKEIEEDGGDAMVLASRVVTGVEDADIEALFRTARDADYAALAEDIKELAKTRKKKKLDDADRSFLADVARLERRLAEIAAIDFFDAPGRARASDALQSLRESGRPVAARPRDSIEAFRGRVWVTRRGVHVDRIATAWLIRRFIDAGATIKLVAPKGYVPLDEELRFDMFEAEYGHEDGGCTLETVIRRFGLDTAGLAAVGEIVHDIDIKDARYRRPETEGVASIINGICLSSASDDERLERGARVFDALLADLQRKKNVRTEGPT